MWSKETVGSVPKATPFHHFGEANSRRHREHCNDQKGRGEEQNLPQEKPVPGSEGTNQESKETKACFLHMEWVFNYFKQVKDSLQIMIFFPWTSSANNKRFFLPLQVGHNGNSFSGSCNISVDLRELPSSNCGIAKASLFHRLGQGTHIWHGHLYLCLHDIDI